MAIMTDSKNKKILSVTIDPYLIDKIDHVCRIQGDSRSAFVERAVREALNFKDEFMRDMENPIARALYTSMAKAPEQLFHVIAKIAGENMTSDDVERLRRNTSLWAEEGKKKQVLKKKGGKKDESSK
jgi:hypothetical protein